MAPLQWHFGVPSVTRSLYAGVVKHAGKQWVVSSRWHLTQMTNDIPCNDIRLHP